MYGPNKYGTAIYGTGGEGVSTEDYYVDLTRLVPEFVAEKREMQELYTAQGYEVGYLQHALEDVVQQCYISTATWGLERWEKIFDIKTNYTLTYEQRREILAAKLRGQGTTTLQMIVDTAQAFSGGDVEVLEDAANHRFVVRFVGVKGIPRNMQGFINMLEEIKPAHLVYAFEYCYTIWDEVTAKIWETVNNITWDDMRVLTIA